MLGRITQDDLVHVDAIGPDPNDNRASSELIVHRAIYRVTGAAAIVHAHPPYATLLSMFQDELAPVDSEGCYLLEKVPVTSIDKTVSVGLPESAYAVSEALKEQKIIMLKGHGSFARGDTLEEAYMLTSCLEASSFYLYQLQGR
jgi:L-fuculose-phosphate aldolase